MKGRTRLFRWIFAAWVKVMWGFRAMLLMIRAAIWSSLHDIWVLLRRSKANLLLYYGPGSGARTRARIPEITSKSTPTIAVYGKNDPDFAPKVDAEVREMNRRFSAVLKAPPLCLDGLGHYPHVENPRAVAEAVLSFVTAGSTW